MTGSVKTQAEAKQPSVKPSSKASAGVALLAQKIIEDNDLSQATQQAALLKSDKESIASAAARVLDELIAQKPQMLVASVDAFAVAIGSKLTRTVSTAAEALPVLAKLAPARVAKHLDQLTSVFTVASPVGKDGLVRTFAALCVASVAYQKRLEPVLALALSEADPKTLQRWTETVLPALKGEPHARARAVVEERLPSLPKPFAQKLAAFLGVKLRPTAVVR